MTGGIENTKDDGAHSAAGSARFGSVETRLDDKQALLYNLSLGCTSKQLQYTFELHDQFHVLPTYGVIPAQSAMALVPLTDVLPNFNPAKLLHGEHYLELMSDKPLPTSGTVVTRPSIVDLQDKGKAAVLVLGCTTVDPHSQQPLAYNEFTTFVVGSGGFSNGRPPQQAPARPPAATAANTPPLREPDAQVTECTSSDQAALYRLNGDLNPLHIDPQFSTHLGFPQPILHGLCTFGLSAKHILQTFGDGNPGFMRSVKVRFKKHVFPGETIQTSMWLDVPNSQVLFETRVLERGEVVMSAAAMQFWHAGQLGSAWRRQAVAATTAAGACMIGDRGHKSRL